MLLPSFTDYLRIEKGYAPATQKAYLSDINALASFLQQNEGLDIYDEVSVKKVLHRSLRNWVASLMKANLSHKSICRKLAAVSIYFHFLQKTAILTQNPVSRIHLPKTEKKLPVFLKQSETENLFEQIEFPLNFEGIRDKCILEVLYGCGLRRSELIQLRLQDIDFYNKMLRVLGKGKKVRLVPFGNHVLTNLKNYQEKSNELGMNLSDTFFVKPDNKPLYDKLVYRICSKYLALVSNLSQHGSHVFRHTYATHLLDAGADLNDIKTLLGHSSLAATQIYTHNSLSKLKNVHSLAHPRAKKKE